ncbi:MAG: RICIN domain-containing protein [Ruminococcus sp.]|nr:RICIN domain-containing protein [Ruminococcus sp.]
MFSIRKAIGKTAGILTAAVLALPGLMAVPGVSAVDHARVSVHDPSVVKLADGGYYIIGSHLGAARSNDLCSWYSAANSHLGTKNTTFFSDIYKDLAVPEKWSNTTNGYDLSGNLWAPDIVYNPAMGKYCMYLSINGQAWNSSIVLCTADNIDGPYTYQGTIVYSGFTNNSVNNVNDTDVPKVLGNNPDISRYLSGSGWNASYGTNAIDPAVFYDENGDLWMIYGSWFGGLYMLELDENTGLRDYNVRYETKANVSDAYMGIRAAGGDFSSGEGPYIEYMVDPDTGRGYYYLFVSYGYFNSNGGYNMRIFRSENPSGPYLDQNGNSAIFSRGTGDANTKGVIGERLMSNYQWSCNDRPFKAQGHNSALMDDDGKLYVVYHTKFDDAYGFHEVRVHQMFINEDGWLTASAYEYSGESLSENGHSADAVIGDYEFIFHTLDQNFVNEQSADVEKPKNITLNANGTVSGDISGTWTMKDGSPNMSISFDNVTYKGEFLVQADESAQQTEKMTFTATGNNTCVWGSKKTAYDISQDNIDLTSYGSLLTYNPENTSFEGGSKTIGDTALLSDISYRLTNKNSGLVLDLENGNSAPGTNIRQWSKIGGSAQEWRICDVGDGWCKIVSMVDESMAVTVDGTDAADGLNIQLEKYIGADDQQFRLVQKGAYYGIVSKCSGGRSGLDVYEISKENGANICQWEYWEGDGQLWKITPVYPEIPEAEYVVRNVNSGLYMAENSGNIEQSEQKQTWTFRKNDDGTFSVLSGGKAVTVENSSAGDGSNISLADFTGSSGQSFTFKPYKDGSYGIMTACSDGISAVDVYNISTEPGANICQWNYWGGEGQRWVIVPAADEKTVVGDVNADGEFSVADLVMLEKWLLGSGEFMDWTAGDMCQDGRIDAFDMQLMRKKLISQL